MFIVDLLNVSVTNVGIIANQATATASPGGGMTQLLIMMVLMIVIFYFLLIRPQNKRAKAHQELVGGLKAGDEIITHGGIVGVVKDIKDQYIMLEIAPGMVITVQRQVVGTVLPKGTVKNINS